MMDRTTSLAEALAGKWPGIRFANGQCGVHGAYTTAIVGGAAGAQCPHCQLEKQRQLDARDGMARLSNTGMMTFWKNGEPRPNVPPRFIDATFETYRVTSQVMQKTVDGIKAFADNFQRGCGRNIVFSGQVGNGKTHLAISAGKRLAERGFRSTYMTIFDLMQPVQQSPYGEVQSMVARLDHYDLVILDEIGAHADFGYSSDLVASTLFQLIDSRYMNKTSMIIVTNVSLDELDSPKSGLGNRAMDRLKDSAAFKFFWDSQR